MHVLSLDRLLPVHFYRMWYLVITCTFIEFAIFSAILLKSWKLRKSIKSNTYFHHVTIYGILTNHVDLFAWGWLWVLCHTWVIEYWLSLLKFRYWPQSAWCMLATQYCRRSAKVSMHLSNINYYITQTLWRLSTLPVQVPIHLEAVL